MITLFTIPKAFTGKIDLIQRNAIQSWLSLPAEIEVMLLGNDQGVAEVAAENKVLHIAEVRVNEFGTPLLDSAFRLVAESAKNEIIVYVNADIIFLPDLISGLKNMKILPSFLLTGRRWDLDMIEPLQCGGSWEADMRERLAAQGCLHGYSGIDYFVFPKTLPLRLPSFTVGRQGWDNWMIWNAKEKRIPVIDATEAVTIIHQNHNYTHSKFAEHNRVGGPETQKNYQLAGNLFHMLSLREADILLTKTGEFKRPLFTRRLFSLLAKSPLWQWLYGWKRRLQNRRDSQKWKW